jgi:predicted anti-sigma-YlaC factor YlaD
MHMKDETLRALLDGELEPAAQQIAEAHLSGCGDCAQRLDKISARAERLASHLMALDLTSPDAIPHPSHSWQRLQRKEKPSMFQRYLRSPAWIALSVVLVLSIALSFQPLRAQAGNFLKLFRVQQITLLPMDLSSLQGPAGEPTIAEAMARMFSDSLVMKREASGPIETTGLLETSTIAGFQMRVVSDADLQEVVLEQGPAFEFTFDRQRAQAILDEAGGDLKLPPDVDQLQIAVDIPYSIASTYGNCSYSPARRAVDPDDPSAAPENPGCLHFIQMPSPTITLTPEIDPAPLAEVGLRYLGLDEDQARQFSQSVDWASTLVVPFPRENVSAQPVFVDGVEGNLLVDAGPGSDGVVEYTLLWVRDGILYLLTSSGDPADGLDFANRLAVPDYFPAP